MRAALIIKYRKYRAAKFADLNITRAGNVKGHTDTFIAGYMTENLFDGRLPGRITRIK